MVGLQSDRDYGLFEACMWRKLRSSVRENLEELIMRLASHCMVTARPLD